MVADHKPVLTLLGRMDEIHGINEQSISHTLASSTKPEDPKPVRA
jgi:hypothetical protein